MQNRPKILIVDDKVENLVAMERILSTVDADLIRALSGNEAIKKTLENDFALCLIDVQMPEMDGFETVELLHSESKTEHVPVIFISAVFSDNFYQIKGIETGALDFIAKPFIPAILIGKVRVHLNLYSQKRELQEAYDTLESQVLERTEELVKANQELRQTQMQILQQEKMASIGQLAAGVAHEINNPVGFVTSNLGTLKKYSEKLAAFIGELAAAVEKPEGDGVVERIGERRKELKIDHILEDIEPLILESLDGTARVKTIVENLKSFSRVDDTARKMADMNECIETTLNIIWNELKYTTTVKKDYGEIPLTKCSPQQLNQVFMNLFVNAAQAIEKQGEITIKTWSDNGSVYISISDTGSGIPEDKVNKIFEPFFTTKEVGKGTGLGLSITYDIVKNHSGEITVASEVGKGTTFTVKIPIAEE